MNNLSGFLSFHDNVSGQMGSNLITNVEANPTGTPTEILASIRVGDIIYSIPSGGGGGGGTNNYNDLLNKPKINNVILSGDLSLSELGIYNPVVMTGATGSADGVAGYAPKPLIADKDKFLKGDGTWSDIPSSGDNAFNYSTNEFIVGKWIDGKDLYQRTIVLKDNDVLNYSYSNNEFVNCLPANMDFIDVVQIYSDRRDSDYIDTRNNDIECIVVPNPTTKNLYFKVSHDPRNCIVTIQYTYL